jgi:hypothetical protein
MHGWWIFFVSAPSSFEKIIGADTKILEKFERKKEPFQTLSFNPYLVFC